jgi:hypothetical protein
MKVLLSRHQKQSKEAKKVTKIDKKSTKNRPKNWQRRKKYKKLASVSIFLKILAVNKYT